MKTKLLIALFIFIAHFSNAQFAHQNINFLGLFNDSTVSAEPVYGIRYQACWGWVDSADGKEYGIIGSTAGTYIIDVSNPTNMVQSDYIPHKQTDCIWHEYKTYGNLLYIISDDGGVNSLQIADLSYLPDSAHVIYDSTDIFVHAHTLYIDQNKLYVASVSTDIDYSSMNVYSLSNPSQPVLLRRLDQDYSFISSVHDMYVINDTVYASCGYQGLYIFKYDTVANQFLLLGSLQDGSNFYNHSSFLSPDHGTLYMCEEVPDGQPVKIVDVTNISSPSLIDTFYSNPGATAHNPSVLDDLLIIAYYQDGVQIYNISNPHAPVLLGYFDTYSANPAGVYTQPAYAGCWSTYNDLPSGVLLASDMQSGLFCLDISSLTGIEDPKKFTPLVFPNPVSDVLTIHNPGNSSIEIFDLNGKTCYKGSATGNVIQLDLSDYNAGVYFLKLVKDERISVQKIILTGN
jgi:choice-of-anchor B domain-containing protein